MASVCFGNLVKIPKNVSAQQSFLLMDHAKKDKILIQYLTQNGWYLAFLY